MASTAQDELDRFNEEMWEYACEVMERINARSESDLAREIRTQRIAVIVMTEVR